MVVHLSQKLVQYTRGVTVRVTGNEYMLFHSSCQTFIPRTRCHDLRRSREKKGGEDKKKTTKTTD